MSKNMFDLKDKLNTILDFIDNKENVVFLDYPLHHNVGDMLIFLGTVKFFEDNDIKIKKFYSAHDYNLQSLMKVIDDNTTIIFHGGGNFGDLYPIHQDFREFVINNFYKNKILILPQTAFFENKENINRSRLIYKKHKNIVMFARDKQTHDLFKSFSDISFLIPDMAHALYGTFQKESVKKGTLYFLRQDIEKSGSQEQFQNIQSYDWMDLISKYDIKVISFIMKMAKLNRVLKLEILNNLNFFLWNRQINIIGGKAALIFSEYDQIITSRLHGHILSCLLDVPSLVVDNSYGKNKAYYEEWTKDLDNTHFLSK